MPDPASEQQIESAVFRAGLKILLVVAFAACVVWLAWQIASTQRESEAFSRNVEALLAEGHNEPRPAREATPSPAQLAEIAAQHMKRSAEDAAIDRAEREREAKLAPTE